MTDTKKPLSPFSGALKSDPKRNRRDAEATMDSPAREETADAQAEKSDALGRRSDDALGEVADGNVRNPLPRR